MNYFFLFLVFTFNSAANILLKLQSRVGVQYHGINWMTLRSNIFFLSGLLLFATNVIFYLLALRSVPISIAYPITTAMSLLIVNGYAYLFLSEKITAGQVVGYLFVVAGIIMIFSFVKKV